MKYKRVMALPDLQIPFQHPYALTFLCRLRDEVKPDLFVNVGDEVDNCALSRYPKDPNGASAGDELKRARRILKAYYQEFPTVYLCESNHRDRLYKRALEAGIPKEYLADVHEYLQAPKGWQWAKSWTFDGVVYEHGDRAAGLGTGEKLIAANHASVVYGHHHEKPGIVYQHIGNRTLWAMNVGCLIDANTYAMSYTRHNRAKPVLSAGLVIEGVPQIVPMLKGLRKR